MTDPTTHVGEQPRFLGDPPRYFFMQMSCPPEGWKQREWITTREQPVVGARYALECTGVEEKDGLVHALFALCPLP